MPNNDEKNESDETSLQPLPKLTKRELGALRYWQQSKAPALAPSLQAKLFNLFLNGKSIEEIHRMNSQLQLGQIVHASISGDWENRYIKYRDDLLTETVERVKIVTLESAVFISDLLAATNKQFGDQIKAYLQSGDTKDLGELQITTLSGYGKAVEILQKLTGQDKQTKTVVSGTMEHTVKPASGQAPTAEEASMILKLLAGK